MINLLAKEYCCGCSGCYSICPVKCISMQSDEEGFLYPQVDIDRCKKCHSCEKVCPIISIAGQKDKIDRRAYAAFIKDNVIRKNSSSGGVFTAIAEKVIEKEGVVFGAAYDEHLQVHHIGVKNVSDLELLRGSKYLQSNIENTYSEVKEHLMQGKTVLFTGTSCQIAGLKNYLNKDYEHLILVGLLCHGVPSPKVWRKYIADQESKSGQKVKMVYFRDKELGWKNYSFHIVFENKQEYKELYYKNPFMKMFLESISLRPSCHSCFYKELERPEDITLGDFWGIEGVAPEMNDDKGSSLLIIHSMKGYQVFSELENLLCSKEVDIERALPKDADSRRSVKPHPKRKEFFEKLDRWEFAKLEVLMRQSLRFRIKNKVDFYYSKFKKRFKVIRKRQRLVIKEMH